METQITTTQPHYNEEILEMFTEADWAWWNDRLNEDDRQELSKLVIGQWLNIVDEARQYSISSVLYWDFKRLIDEDDIRLIKTTTFFWDLYNSQTKKLTEDDIKRSIIRGALIVHNIFPPNDQDWSWDWESIFPEIFTPMLNNEPWYIPEEEFIEHSEWLVTIRFVFRAIAYRLCLEFDSLSPSRLFIVANKLTVFTFTDSPILLADLNLANTGYLNPVLMAFCIFYATTTCDKNFTNQNCWRAIYRVLHDRGFECALSPETFIAYMYREIDKRLHKFFIAWEAENKWKSPFSVKWEVDEKSGKVKVDSSPLRGQTRDQYPFYQETPWKEWEDKRREIKKNFPADFKKICGTEDTLDSMIAVAKALDLVLMHFCDKIEEETLRAITNQYQSESQT